MPGVFVTIKGLFRTILKSAPHRLGYRCEILRISCYPHFFLKQQVFQKKIEGNEAQSAFATNNHSEQQKRIAAVFRASDLSACRFTIRLYLLAQLPQEAFLYPVLIDCLQRAFDAL